MFISEVTYATQDIDEIRAVHKMINLEITTLTNLKQQTDENVSSINQLQHHLGTRMQWLEKKVADLDKELEAVKIMLEKKPKSTDISIEGKRFIALFLDHPVSCKCMLCLCNHGKCLSICPYFSI